MQGAVRKTVFEQNCSLHFDAVYQIAPLKTASWVLQQPCQLRGFRGEDLKELPARGVLLIGGLKGFPGEGRRLEFGPGPE